MFCYYLLVGDPVVLNWLYARLCHAFLVYVFFSKSKKNVTYVFELHNHLSFLKRRYRI